MKFAFLVAIVTAWVMLLAHNVKADETVRDVMSDAMDRSVLECVTLPPQFVSECLAVVERGVSILFRQVALTDSAGSGQGPVPLRVAMIGCRSSLEMNATASLATIPGATLACAGHAYAGVMP